MSYDHMLQCTATVQLPAKAYLQHQLCQAPTILISSTAFSRCGVDIWGRQRQKLHTRGHVAKAVHIGQDLQRRRRRRRRGTGRRRRELALDAALWPTLLDFSSRYRSALPFPFPIPFPPPRQYNVPHMSRHTEHGLHSERACRLHRRWLWSGTDGVRRSGLGGGRG